MPYLFLRGQNIFRNFSICDVSLVNQLCDWFCTTHLRLENGVCIKSSCGTMIKPALALHRPRTAFACGNSRSLFHIKLLNSTFVVKKYILIHTLNDGVPACFGSEARALGVAAPIDDGRQSDSLEPLLTLTEQPASSKSLITKNRSVCFCSWDSTCLYRSSSRLSLSRSNCRFVFSLALTFIISISPWFSNASFSLSSSSNNLF